MTGAIFIFLFYLVIVLIGDKKEKKIKATIGEKSPLPFVDTSDTVYDGATKSITLNETESILEKHYSYYTGLQADLKKRFLTRTFSFITNKIFIIKSNEGYREMPVLVSAAAVHLTFGLEDYLLPFYRYIRIYPQEYFGDGPFKVLAGNVEDNVITIAWNHFLKGNEDLTDGSNVGLHEMSHALYFQKLVIDPDSSRTFCKRYDHVMGACKEAYQSEKSGQKNLYSAYADTDLQEFWAESTEIFFEKPNELSRQYPAVYEAMKSLLLQNPLDKTYPLIKEQTSYWKNLLKF